MQSCCREAHSPGLDHGRLIGFKWVQGGRVRPSKSVIPIGLMCCHLHVPSCCQQIMTGQQPDMGCGSWYSLHTTLHSGPAPHHTASCEMSVPATARCVDDCTKQGQAILLAHSVEKVRSCSRKLPRKRSRHTAAATLRRRTMCKRPTTPAHNLRPNTFLQHTFLTASHRGSSGNEALR
ncbi:hypothetical protein HaLaN_25576 [Haematococcus lacustris]|uniref:Uncharacterized protein n=1 Tax=Haematococcus lacustris TaxID=44745 RepID=A0A6A0A0C4_HAELA|nr:hypothetical protein HaLaN_25576 [Haematococcus lacustris]